MSAQPVAVDGHTSGSFVSEVGLGRVLWQSLALARRSTRPLQAFPAGCGPAAGRQAYEPTCRPKNRCLGVGEQSCCDPLHREASSVWGWCAWSWRHSSPAFALSRCWLPQHSCWLGIPMPGPTTVRRFTAWSETCWQVRASTVCKTADVLKPSRWPLVFTICLACTPVANSACNVLLLPLNRADSSWSTAQLP